MHRFYCFSCGKIMADADEGTQERKADGTWRHFCTYACRHEKHDQLKVSMPTRVPFVPFFRNIAKRVWRTIVWWSAIFRHSLGS